MHCIHQTFSVAFWKNQRHKPNDIIQIHGVMLTRIKISPFIHLAVITLSRNSQATHTDEPDIRVLGKGKDECSGLTRRWGVENAAVYIKMDVI